ncbi:MAG TPA: PEGA domain-containing protein [Polyangium sp.]|nr:PEGA domain-containing protein [Polyangium sp.]
MRKLALMLIGVLFASPCLAQTKVVKSAPKNIKENAKEEADARVEKLYNDGVAAAKRQQWDKAEQFFEEALLLNPDPEIAANLGYAELSGGKAREAAEHLYYYLQEDKSADSAARAEIQALLDKAQAKIVTVKVNVDQKGAEIYINGFYSGQSPLNKRIFLNPGRYLFEAKKRGMNPGSQALDLQASYDIPVNLVMGEATIGTVLSNGMVRVEEKAPRWHQPLHYASLGAGLVGLGLSVGFTTGFWVQEEVAKRQHETINQAIDEGILRCPPQNETGQTCLEIPLGNKEQNAYAAGSIVGYSLAAIGAVGTVIWYITRPKTKLEKGSNVGIVVGPSRVALFGVF